MNKDSANLALMDAYRKHMVNMFKLFGFTEEKAKQRMERVLKLETRIAEFSLSRTELRDVEKNYNKMSFYEFKAKYPYYPLDELLAASGIDKKYVEKLVLGQPKYMEGLNELIRNMNAEDLRAKLEWDFIE